MNEMNGTSVEEPQSFEKSKKKPINKNSGLVYMKNIFNPMENTVITEQSDSSDSSEDASNIRNG
jgi:hypothetical protein